MVRPRNKLALSQTLDPAVSVERAGKQASATIDKHIIRRWQSVSAVRQHVAVWLLLLVLIMGGLFVQNRQLAAYYRKPDFTAGGSYIEGVVGSISNLNPIFATGLVDQSAAKLLFASLLKYDNDDHLVGDLAQGMKVSESGTDYTLTLQPNLTWHDGQPLTSRDVAFTFRSIQHPDTRSPLNQSWQAIKIDTPDDQTVVFHLPVALSAFPQSLTTGIIPEHILGNVAPSQLRSHPFNNKEPIGSGPFRYGATTTLALDSKELNLTPFEHYYGGKPKLDKLTLRTYGDQESALHGFRIGDVQAVAGVSFVDTPDLGRSGISVYNLPQTNGVFAFFKTSAAALSDAKVRQALVQSLDVDALVRDNLKGTRHPLTGPLLRKQLVFDNDTQQLGFDAARANQLLDEAGWRRTDPSSPRTKDGKPLELSLITQNTTEYSVVATALQQAWEKVGVKIKVDLISDQDIQQSYIVPHNYDILLYGVSLGIDPDVYVYWHSKESGLGGFNLSEYKSSAADAGLEAGRTRSDVALRAIKYRGFLTAWRNDAPAAALYQPTFDYVQTTQLNGFTPHTLVLPGDRFNNVQNWMTSQRVSDK